MLNLVAGHPNIEATQKPKTSTLKEARTSVASIQPEATSIVEVVMEILEELDELLTVEGMAQLLTAKPGEHVAFGDHTLRGKFYGEVNPTEIEEEIQQAIEEGVLGLSIISGCF